MIEAHKGDELAIHTIRKASSYLGMFPIVARKREEVESPRELLIASCSPSSHFPHSSSLSHHDLERR